MSRTLRNIGRLVTIIRVLNQHGLLLPLELAPRLPWIGLVRRWVRATPPSQSLGDRLAAALIALGPSYIKLGQVISTRPDVVGEAVAARLSVLQDRLAPFDTETAKQIIETELGRPIDLLFSRFDEQPVAAASIAQVHFAITTDGRDVAVKVLRPGIERAFDADLQLLFWLLGWMHYLAPALRRRRLPALAAIAARTVRDEMDLRLEASAAAELHANFEDDPTFRVPKIDWDRSARRVLTLERIIGFKADEVDAIHAAGINTEAVVTKAAVAFFNSALRDGFFHGDLHPGNLFVTPDGNLAVVDFGIMGRLDWPSRYFLADLILAFLRRDYRRAATAHVEAGIVTKDQSIEALTQAIRAVGEPLHGKSIGEISFGELLGQLIAVASEFDMEGQPRFLLLQKSMVTAEGVGRVLSPGANMWNLTRPLVERWMRENRGPEARLGIEARRLLDAADQVPRLLGRAEDALAKWERAQDEPSAPAVRLPWLFAGLALGWLLFG
jgi:ubiquinone biosynthesis protein